MTGDDPLSDALADLDALRAAGLAAFAGAATPEQAEAARVEFLGQKQGGSRRPRSGSSRSSPPPGRPMASGSMRSRRELEAAFEAARTRVENEGGGPRADRRDPARVFARAWATAIR